MELTITLHKALSEHHRMFPAAKVYQAEVSDYIAPGIRIVEVRAKHFSTTLRYYVDINAGYQCSIIE